MAARGLARAAGVAGLLWGLACATSSPMVPLPEPVAGVPERTLLVSVAGLTAGALDAEMPVLRALADAGALATQMRSVSPATVYPAHATLVTGVPTNVHGVVSDHLLGDHGVRATRYAHASHLKVATLWQRAVESGMSVASLDWPSTLGAAIPLLLPDPPALRPGVSWAEAVREDATPAVHALLVANGGGAIDGSRPGPERDAALTEIACALLGRQASPRLVLLHLGQTAAALAAHGPGTAEAAAAFRGADREIARLIECLAWTGSLERSALVVVGDHGVAAVHTEIAPNAVLARNGLIELAGGRMARWFAIARSNGGSAFVYARDERAALRAREILTRVAHDTRAFRVVSAEEMLRADADAEAWFGLEAEPGYRFGDAARTRLLEPSAARGAAGYLSERAEMDTVFIAWGSGVRSGIRIPGMRQTDVAPTLARLLGLSLDEATGRPLVGVLSVAGPAPVGSGAEGAAPPDDGR